MTLLSTMATGTMYLWRVTQAFGTARITESWGSQSTSWIAAAKLLDADRELI